MIFDGHCDVLYKMWENKNRKAFYHDPTSLHSSFERLRQGGVRIQTMAIFVPPEVPKVLKTRAALEMIDLLYEEILSSNKVKLLKDFTELKTINHQDDVLHLLLTLEGADPLQGDLMYLRTLYQLGVRSIGLTWNYRNEVADGVKERNPAGLSHFGMQLIKEMNRLHMAVDISHLSEKGFWDCLEHSTEPVMASHCNVRQLCDHPRNLYDDQIKAIFQHGGVIGVNFVPYFLTKEKQATITDVLRHVEYLLSLGGEDQIGMGSDFDGIDEVVFGLENATKFSELYEECLKLYSPSIVQKLFFENWKNYYIKLS